MANGRVVPGKKLISGDGEMSTLVRTYNWSDTSFGPIDSWSQNFRTIINLCLNSPFPVVVWWGEDMNIFYNNAYRQVFGPGRTLSPGAPGSKVLPELWDSIGPKVAHVLSTSQSVSSENELLLMERDGFTRESYFTFSYSPVYNESGNIDGVFTTVSETTLAVISGRHLQFLAKLTKNISKSKSIDNIFRKTIKVLESNSQDFPFSILYMVNENAASATLVGATGVQLPHTSAPELIDFSKQMIGSRNLYKCVQTGEPVHVTDLRARLGDMPGGAWKVPPEEAFIMPIKKASAVLPYAVLVIGINPHRRLDEAYQSFFHLVAEQVATEIAYVLSYDEQVNIRKRMEDRQRQIYNLIMQAPVAMAVLMGKDFVVEVANEKALQFWGRRASPIVGKPLFSIINNENVSGFNLILERVYETGEGFFTPQFPAKISRRGKMEDIFIGFAIEALREVDGSIIGVMLVANEVTELVMSKLKIEESEERLKMAIQLTKIGTWEYHPNTGELNWSEQCREIYALPHGTTLDFETFEQHIHPADRAFVLDAIKKAMDPDSNEPYNLVYRILRFDDHSERWIRTGGKVYFNEDKKPKLFIGTVLDITEEKNYAEQLEAKVVKRTKELQGRKDFIEVILDASLVLIIVFDLDSRILSFNKKCEKVFGITKEDAIGRTFSEVFPGMEKSVTYKSLHKALGGEYVHISSYQAMINARYYESFFEPLRNEKGEIYAVLMTAHDITDNIQATSKLKDLNEELKRSNLDLEQFAYIASHDLQEPLRKIQVFAELLQNNIQHADVAEGYINKINSSASRMSELIKAVLNYSRLSRTPDEIEWVNLQEIVQTVTLDFELRISETNATIVYNDLPEIKGFRLQLTQLFSNLLSNSLKFSRTNPHITINCRKLLPNEQNGTIPLNSERDYLEISFQDNGIGFEAKYLDRIFTIFQRLNEKTSYEGTGIGLALCKKIVENHKGYITATSELGKGSIFYVYLPL